MARGNVTPGDEFVKALMGQAPRFGVEIEAGVAEGLRAYFEIVMRWSPRLHLVAPCTPGEFATRHVLESLYAARHLPAGAEVVDVGSGAGLPVIPCLVARADVRARLVESSQKKAVFLREALGVIGRRDAAEVVAERFERVPPPVMADVLTCRALDRFADMLPALAAWSANIKRLLLFGGESLRGEIEKAGLQFSPHLVPTSEQRFLFVIDRTPRPAS